MSSAHVVARPPGQRENEVVEEFGLYLCNESFTFLYIFGGAKIGEREGDRGRDACRGEDKSISCFVWGLVSFPCKGLVLSPFGAVDPQRIG